MKNHKLKLTLSCVAVCMIALLSCKKSGAVNPSGTDKGTKGGNTGTGNNTTKHIVDAKLVGTWLWTKGSSAAYYDSNGTYIGDAYGFATQYTVNADGSGTCYSHIYSSLGPGSTIVVDISSKGFFETDNQGHMGYFPTNGTYESSNSGSRALYPGELYDENTGTGKSYVYQQLTFTSQGGRQCFTTTASSGTMDTYFKVK